MSIMQYMTKMEKQMLVLSILILAFAVVMQNMFVAIVGFWIELSVFISANKKATVEEMKEYIIREKLKKEILAHNNNWVKKDERKKNKNKV